MKTSLVQLWDSDLAISHVYDVLSTYNVKLKPMFEDELLSKFLKLYGNLSNKARSDLFKQKELINSYFEYILYPSNSLDITKRISVESLSKFLNEALMGDLSFLNIDKIISWARWSGFSKLAGEKLFVSLGNYFLEATLRDVRINELKQILAENNLSILASLVAQKKIKQVSEPYEKINGYGQCAKKVSNIFYEKHELNYGGTCLSQKSSFTSFVEKVSSYFQSYEREKRDETRPKTSYVYRFLCNLSSSLESTVVETLNIELFNFSKLIDVFLSEYRQGEKSIVQFLADVSSMTKNNLMKKALSVWSDRPEDLEEKTCRLADFDTKGCLKRNELKLEINEFFDVIRMKTSGKSLSKEMIHYLHPDKSTELPSGKAYRFTFKTLFVFLERLDMEGELVTIHSPGGSSRKIKMTYLEMLETIVREIDFLNNFYGSYFVNELSQSTNYKKTIKKFKKYMKATKISSGFFRSIGNFPKSTKWKMRNLLNVFDALFKIDYQYKDFDGNELSLSDFAISVMKVLRVTSDLESQSFTPLQKPQPELVNNHTGKALTRLMDMSLLRNLRDYISHRNGSINTFLKSETFKSIDQNLLAKFGVDKLSDSFSKIVNDKKNLELMISDFIEWSKESDIETVVYFEQMVVQAMQTISLSKRAKFDSLLPIIELVVENWPDLRIAMKIIFFDTKLYKIGYSISNFLNLNFTSSENEVVSQFYKMIINPEYISYLFSKENLRKFTEALPSISLLYVKVDSTQELLRTFVDVDSSSLTSNFKFYEYLQSSNQEQLFLNTIFEDQDESQRLIEKIKYYKAP